MLIYENQRAKMAITNECNFTFLGGWVNGYVAGSIPHICQNNLYHTWGRRQKSPGATVLFPLTHLQCKPAASFLTFPDVTPKYRSVMGSSSIPSFGKLHVTFLTLTLTYPNMNLDLELLKRNILNVSFSFFFKKMPYWDVFKLIGITEAIQSSPRIVISYLPQLQEQFKFN